MQIFEKPLHIREPPRGVQQGFRLQAMAEAKCCNCCCVCGQAELTLESDSTALMQTQVFRARGLVDNTRGTTKIKGFKVVLREQLKQIS